MDGTKRTCDVYHLPVVSGHELDVHLLPDTGSVSVPGDRALVALLEYVARAGRAGGGIGADERGAGDDGCDTSISKHCEGYYGV